MMRSFHIWIPQVSNRLLPLIAGISLTLSLWSETVAAITPMVDLRPITQYQASHWVFWQGLFRSEPPVPPDEGGGRGDICLMAPTTPSSDQAAPVWQTQPTFVWQGGIARIEVHERGQDEMLWASTVVGQETATYEGQPLIPGILYEWHGYLPYADQPAFKIPFTVLPTNQQVAIAQHLEQLDQAALMVGLSAEEKAIQRADYFASQALWSDFWQEVLSVAHPSEELNNALDEIVTIFCHN